MKAKRAKRGRPRTKGVLRNFKFTPAADMAMIRMAERCGWTKTMTVERALIFANAHKDFGHDRA